MSLLKWFSDNVKKVFSKKNPLKFFVVHLFKKIIRIISTLFPTFLDIVPIIYRKGNFNLRLAPTLLSYVMYEYEEVREEDEKFIASLLKEGDIYLDVGANVGNTTLSAAYAVGDSGHVYSYEAHPRTYKYLERSIACNQNLISRITTKNVALGEKRGEVFFTDLQNDDINKVSNAGKVKVQMETLDEQKLPARINVLKIDVEGYEFFVLKGAQQLLNNTDILIFESYTKNYETFDVTLKDVISYLHGLGFVIYKKLEGNNLIRIKEDYSSLDCEDLIACKDEHILTGKGLKIG